MQGQGAFGRNFQEEPSNLTLKKNLNNIFSHFTAEAIPKSACHPHWKIIKKAHLGRLLA